MSDYVLGCIGDDYTGSSDLANALTRAGLRTIQVVDVPGEDLVLPPADAIVIGLKCRSIASDEAVAMARRARAWLKARGVRHLMYKVCSTFDSTDQGNIGPVMDALREDEETGLVLVNCAFPATRRTIYQGCLFVDGVPLNESPLKDHPLNPMHDANLARVLGRQSRHRIGLVSLQDVHEGSVAIGRRMKALSDQGCGAAIVDSIFDSDMDAIGQAAFATRLSVGASGLGVGLARAFIRSGQVAESAALAQTHAPVGGPIAALAGSCSAATLDQIAAAKDWAQTLVLDVEALMAGPDEVQRATQWALSQMDRGPVLLASSASPDKVQSLQARFGRDEVGHAVESAMASIAKTLTDAGLRRLIVAGGETSGAVVDRLGLSAFAIGPEIAPGVPVLSSIGGPGSQMVLALKSGNFGGRDFFADAARLMP